MTLQYSAHFLHACSMCKQFLDTHRARAVPTQRGSRAQAAVQPRPKRAQHSARRRPRRLGQVLGKGSTIVRRRYCSQRGLGEGVDRQIMQTKSEA